jgi:hypothetical protein
MGRQGQRYRQQDNCFVWLEDYERAQALMEQLRSNRAELLEKLAQDLNPFGKGFSNVIAVNITGPRTNRNGPQTWFFQDADFLKRLMPLLVRHGMLQLGSADVMRYLGRKINQSGEIPASFQGKLETDFQRRQEGERVKYRCNGNSIKFYDKAYKRRAGGGLAMAAHAKGIADLAPPGGDLPENQRSLDRRPGFRGGCA